MPKLEDDIERILGAMAELSAYEGKSAEVAVLAHSTHCLEQKTFDRWNGIPDTYRVVLRVPPYLFAQLVDNISSLEESLVVQSQKIVRGYEWQIIDQFVIVSDLTANESWRENAKAWLKGEGVSNQGRVRSDNVAPKMKDGLLFRSQPEIELYGSLKDLGVAFAPLPVFVRGGEAYRRIEPDFVIVKDGITVVIEVDGDAFHTENPQQAHERVTMLVHEGVHVERINAKDCDTPDKAKRVANKILVLIQKLKTNK